MLFLYSELKIQKQLPEMEKDGHSQKEDPEKDNTDKINSEKENSEQEFSEESPDSEAESAVPKKKRERIKRTFMQKVKAAYAAFSLHNLKEKLDDFIGISFKIFLSVAIIIVGSTLYTELTDRRYSVTSFELPKQFQEEGLTGNAAVKKLLGEVDDLQRGADTVLSKLVALAELEDETGSFRELRRNSRKQVFVSSADKQAVNVDVMGVGVSVDAVIYYIRRLLGIKTRTIQGLVTTDGSKIRLLMDMTDAPSQVRLEVPYDSLIGNEKCLNKLLSLAALQMLEVTSPNGLALHYLAAASNDLTAENDTALVLSIRTFRKTANNSKLEDEDRAYAYSMLGYLTYLKAPLDARKKYADRKYGLDSLQNVLNRYEQESRKLKSQADTLQTKLSDVEEKNAQVLKFSKTISTKLLKNSPGRSDSLRLVKRIFRNKLDSLEKISASNTFLIQKNREKFNDLNIRIDTLGNAYASLKNRYDNLYKAYATDFEQEKSRLGRQATKKAIVLFNKALNIDDKSAPAYQLWALVLYSEKNYFKAIEKLKELIENADKRNVDAILNWAFILEHMGYFHEAAEKYRRIMKIDPTNLTALSAWMSILEEHPSDKEYEEIIRYAKALIEEKPNSEKAYLYLAQAYHRTDKFDKAEVFYRKALSISEQNFWVLKNLGELYVQLAKRSGMKTERSHYFGKAFAVFEDIGESSYIGALRLNEFQKKLRLESTGRTVGLDSELFPEYISLKGKGDIAGEQGKIKDALRLYGQIIKPAREDYRYGKQFIHEANDLILRTFAAANRNEDFYSSLDSALKEGIPVWENLKDEPYAGFLEIPDFKNRIKQNAIEPLRLRAENETAGREQVFAYDSLAYRYRLIGEYDSAVFYSRRAIQLDSSSPYAYATLAETYGFMKKKKEFFRFLDSAVKYRFEIWNFIQEKPYDEFSREAAFRELIEKYEKKNEYDFL